MARVFKTLGLSHSVVFSSQARANLVISVANLRLHRPEKGWTGYQRSLEAKPLLLKTKLSTILTMTKKKGFITGKKLSRWKLMMDITQRHALREKVDSELTITRHRKTLVLFC